MINGVYVDKDGDYCYKNGKYESGIDHGDKRQPSVSLSGILCKHPDQDIEGYIKEMIDKYNARPCLPLEFLQ